MKGKAILVISLMLGAMVASSSFARAAVIQAPSWVPNKIAGWNLVYNATLNTSALFGADLDFGSTNLVSNWTQMWIKNDSTNGITGTLATADLEYDQDYFSQPVNATLKTYLAKVNMGGVTFSGNTIWDLFFWMMNSTFSSQDTDAGISAAFSDETKNITGAMGACSFNMTAGGVNIYVLMAYSGKYTMIITSLDIPASLTDWLSADDTDLIGNFVQTYVMAIVTMFVLILSIFTNLNKLAGELPSTSAVVPPHVAATAPPSTKTSKDDVKAFAITFVSTATPPAVPAYPLFALGVFGIIGVAIIARKRKMLVA